MEEERTFGQEDLKKLQSAIIDGIRKKGSSEELLMSEFDINTDVEGIITTFAQDIMLAEMQGKSLFIGTNEGKLYPRYARINGSCIKCIKPKEGNKFFT